MSRKKRFVQIEGDVDIWQYGGTLYDRKHEELVHIDGLDGQPELWDWGVPGRGFKLPMYRFPLEPVEGYVLNWVCVASVCRSNGITTQSFGKLPITQQWCMIARYYGWENLDSYPIQVNKTEYMRYTNGYK